MTILPTKYDYHQSFLAGYWRCEAPNYTFDFYVREDGFHIGAIPETYEHEPRFIPMPLWLHAETAGDIIVSSAKKNASWRVNYYKDGNRLVMNRLGRDDSWSISRRISERDISAASRDLFEEFLLKFPSRVVSS